MYSFILILLQIWSHSKKTANEKEIQHDLTLGPNMQHIYATYMLLNILCMFASGMLKCMSLPVLISLYLFIKLAIFDWSKDTYGKMLQANSVIVSPNTVVVF